MDFHEVLHRLKKVKKRGASYTALCPAHADNHPSLSITVGIYGRTLLHCHVGCSLESICAAIGIQVKELFGNDSFKGKTQPQPYSKSPASAFQGPTRASVERCDVVYRTLLETLTLTRHHADNLESRGLSDTTIARNLYSSAPNEV